MSKSAMVKHEDNVDLGTLTPDPGGMADHWKVDWARIRAAQVGGIYMRPLFTLTPGGSPHFNGIIVLHGQLVLFDTWYDDEISLHTQLSLAFHTLEDGYKSKLTGVRVQLPNQGKNKTCWSRLFVYMAALARDLMIDSDYEHALHILGRTQVKPNMFCPCNVFDKTLSMVMQVTKELQLTLLAAVVHCGRDLLENFQILLNT